MKPYHYLAIALLLTTNLEARADMSSAKCQVYTFDRLSPAVVVNMKRSDGKAARICRFPNGKVEYTYVLTGPWKDGRVCGYEQLDASDDGLVKYNQNRTYVGVAQYMGAPGGPVCPGHAHGSYIFAANVSPGLFLELNQFWNTLFNPTNFDAATAGLPAHDRAVVNEVRNLLRGRPKLSEISLHVFEPISGIPWIHSGYVLNGPVAQGQGFSLTIDLTKNGFVILTIKRFAV